MPWLGRWAREARLARTAGNIGDPVLRLRFLRTAGPRTSFVRRLAHGQLRHWIFWAGLLLVLLIPFLMKLAAGKPEPLHDAPMPPHRAPAGEAQKTVPVWQVEQTGDSEVYSNGLRIDTRFTVANRPRLYTAFQRDGTSSVSRVRRSQPAGIVYHTTESCQAPFEAQDTPVLKRLGESLLEYVRRKRAYHYLIDRFGRVYRVVAESDTAYHAGYSVWADDEWFYVNLNEGFLGISFEAQTSPGPRRRHADRNAPQPLPDSRRKLRHPRPGLREPLEHAGGISHRLGGGLPVCGVRLAGQLPAGAAFALGLRLRLRAGLAGFQRESHVVWRQTGGTGYRAPGRRGGYAAGGLSEGASRAVPDLPGGGPPEESADRYAPLRLRWPVAVLPHHAPRRFRRIRQHVKERAGAHALEDEAAAILIGFHPIVYTGRGKDRFQPQRLVQPLGDIHQHGILAFKKRCFLAHVSLRGAVAAAIFTILGDIWMEGLMADSAVCSIGREEELHWLALTLIPGLGTRMAGKLLDRFRTPQAAFRASRSELEAAGVSGAVAQSVASGCSFEDAFDQQRKMAERGAVAIVRSDPRYPALLREIFDPPILLFARGRLELLQPFHFAVVGTRRPTPYGLAAAERLSADLARAGMTIVSGMA